MSIFFTSLNATRHSYFHVQHCWSACPQRLLSTAAGSSDTNHKTKEGLWRRGEAEAVKGDLHHNLGSCQTKVLLQRLPCECHTATGRDVWAALPYISCRGSECHCESISHAEQGKQNCLSSMRIQNSRAAVVLWHFTRSCRDTTSRRHFLRLQFCWTWQRLKLSGVS